MCPAIPLPASTTTFSRRMRGQVDEVAQVLGVRREHVPLRHLPAADAAVGVGHAVLGQVADLGEAGVLADRPGAGAAQLDAVVPRRVVAGREHRAGQVEAAAGEVELVGRGEADRR